MQEPSTFAAIRNESDDVWWRPLAIDMHAAPKRRTRSTRLPMAPKEVVAFFIQQCGLELMSSKMALKWAKRPGTAPIQSSSSG